MNKKKFLFACLVSCMVLFLSFVLAPSTFGSHPSQDPTPVGGAERTTADSLFKDGIALFDSGDYLGAVVKYKAALLIYQEIGDQGQSAVTLTKIGQAYIEARNYNLALQFYENALNIYRQIDDKESEADILRQEGSLFKDTNLPAKALEMYKEALDLYREVSDRASEARCLQLIGEINQSQNKFEEALVQYQLSHQIYQSLGRDAEQASTSFDIGSMQKNLGKYTEALNAYQEALVLYRKLKDRGDEEITLNNIGTIYDDVGESTRALEFYKDSLTIARELDHQKVMGVILNNMGLIYMDLGLYGDAFRAYTEALTIQEDFGTRSEKATTLDNFGTYYARLKDYSKALDLHLEALEIHRATYDRSSEAADLNNIGVVLGQSGYQTLALNYYLQALQIESDLGDRAGVGQTLTNIGATFAHLGENTTALDYYKQALEIQRQIANPAGEANTLNQMGTLYALLEQYPDALKSFQEALKIRNGTGDRSGEASTLDNIGFIFESQGELQTALDYYFSAISILEDVRTTAKAEEIKTDLSRRSADVYESAVLVLLRIGRPVDAFNLAERARARTFLDQLGNIELKLTGGDSLLLNKAQTLRVDLGAIDRRLRVEESKPADQQNPDLIKSLKSQLLDKQNTYQELLIQIKLNDPEYASLVQVSTLTLPEVQKLIARDEMLVSYFVTDKETIAFVISTDSFETIELPVTAADLRSAITEFRRFSNVEDSSERLYALYNQLINPLRKYMKTPRIGIIPHGILHYIPFAALTDGHRSVIDDFSLFYLPSASVLPFIQEKRKAPSENMMALAESQPEGFPRLSYANQEVESIARLFNSQALTDDQATETLFKMEAGNYSILHLAAHSQLDESNPLFSRLLLAADSSNDGSLEVHEIYGLNLKNANLVVLSACETELGEHSVGDDIVGLDRAFIYAGTPSVIASLWYVDDQATSSLMNSFYFHLKRGLSKADSLRAAQLETRIKYPSPYFWASFVLTGDPA